MKAESTFSLKDRLFNAGNVEQLAARFEQAWPAFPRRVFIDDVVTGLPRLELKQRIAHIAAALHRHLPPDYDAAVEIIRAALPEPLDPRRTDDDYGDFIHAPLSLFVAQHGCTQARLRTSLAALREITMRFSAEDAVRFFINTFPDETLAFLRDCAEDEHYHVRRLASEGTRPLLPWAQRLTIDYRRPLPILDTLFADRTRYVTRSVANHLNDISKLDADLVLATLARWHDRGLQQPDEMRFITQHALRTLVRRGHPAALARIGVAAGADIDILELSTTTPRVRVGDAFRFAVRLRANRPQDLLIDYVMTFAATAGRAPGSKVFRLKRLSLDAGEEATLEKAHAMRLMTTRRLAAGEHRITLQVNGRPHGTLTFQLLLP